MQQVIHFLLKTTNWILVGVLGLLGISCGGPEDEYGTPYSTYTIKGKVTDSENQPVAGAEIRINESTMERFPELSLWLHTDTIRSDANGTFSWTIEGYSSLSFRFITTAPENSEGIQTLKNDTTFVSLKDADYIQTREKEKEVNITLEKYIDPHTAPYYLFTFFGQITGEDGSPLPGIIIRTTPDDNAPYSAITDEWGKYGFTIDPDTLSELTLYMTLYPNYADSHYQSDSITINLDEIELSKGSGMLIGKGSKEINFTLKRK